MSEELAVVNQTLQMGEVGMGASIFKARPSQIELVHKTSRQENVKFGEFRVNSTNEHLGSVIRVVLLAVPQQQREWFKDPNVFNKENKVCFSLDGINPHPRAAAPPAMFCKTCSKGDINWVAWNKNKIAANLPPCGAYWHLLLADRNTQTPYFLNIKGKSALPFRQAMEQQMSGLLAKVFANVRAENKKRGYTLVTLTNGEQEFRPTQGFVFPEGQTERLPQEPMPNIFDVSFDIFAAESKDHGPFVMGFKKFALMSPEDKAEFGQLYLDLMQQKLDYKNLANDEAEANAAVAEAAASTAPVQGEVLPPTITI